MPAPDRRRRRGPDFERLEARELLSLSGLLMRRAAAGPMPGAALVGSAGGLEPVRTPAGRELRGFAAAFSGQSRSGPGRSADVARQFYLAGGGTSTAFLKGSVQLVIEVPADPSEPIRGQAALYPQNYVVVGSLLVLDLRADPPAEPGALPRRLTWEVSDNSGGIFTDAEGSGTLDLDLGRRGGRGPSSPAGATFRGRVETVGIFDPSRVNIGGP